MREAVIVSTARTPIGKAYRGAFNNTQAQTLGGHAIAEAVKRAGIDPSEVDDVVMGAAMSMDRQCASGLMAISTAAKQIIADGMTVTVGGGLESISLVQNEHANT